MKADFPLQVEHNTTDPGSNTNTSPRRRPDMSTFFATLSEISPDPEHPDHRPHAVPVPGDVSAAFYSLAEAFEAVRRDFARVNENADSDGQSNDDLLTEMIQNLLGQAETPPREVEGVSEEFCDSKAPSNLFQSSKFTPSPLGRSVRRNSDSNLWCPAVVGGRFFDNWLT